MSAFLVFQAKPIEITTERLEYPCRVVLFTHTIHQNPEKCNRLHIRRTAQPNLSADTARI
jgi:hypothetical protein